MKKRAALFGWVMYDWAAQPFFTLITTFIFAPYYAAHIAESPARGQSDWALATAAAGLVLAISAPILGCIADAQARRLPWVALCTGIVIGCSISLWWVTPNNSHAMLLALAAFAVATIGAEFAIVLTNAMIPDLAPANQWGRLSGTGWAVGYVGGIMSLIVVVGFLAADLSSGVTLLGSAPLFDLDPVAHEGTRAAGPLTGLWYLLFALPLFLFVREKPKTVVFADAVRSGLRAFVRSIKSLPSESNVLTYLIAHMIYYDGLVALFAFGGIYGAGVFGWQSTELGLFGILLALTGAIGAYLGGKVDDMVGAKTVILGALLSLISSTMVILSIDTDSIFFVVPVTPPVLGDGLFASAGERLFMATGALVGIAAGPLQAASRSLLARLAPPDRITEFFGFYALSGKVTSFMGPFAVGIVTLVTDSQRIGASVLLIFFIGGALVLTRVRAR